MFYSHEILTSRKYGVATVWLVGTLGPTSTALKVKRKQILGVDVKKACETIIQPEAPMALRLQSSLLYGVSRVYSQQCGYVLHDAQTAQNNMRALLKIVKSNAIDLDAGTTRPDQLMLMDDPAFVPGLALPSLPALDFNTLNQVFEDSQYSMLSSLNSPGVSRISSSSQASILGLQIQSSDNDTTGQLQFPGRFQLESSTQKTPSGVNLFDDDEPGLLNDLDFEFDDDGAMVEVSIEELERRRTSVYPAGTGRLESDSAASGRVRRDHEDALVSRPATGIIQDGDFIMQMDNDMDILPDAEAFPKHQESKPRGDHESEFEESSISADVPMKKRKRRVHKAVSDLDIRLDIRNAEISEWQQNYVQNMSVAKHAKTLRSARHYAVANATIFIWANGIGGIGKTIRSSGNIPHPLDIFRGDKLRNLVTGVKSPPSHGNKRIRSAFNEDDDEVGRNVRARPDSESQLPRAVGDDAFVPNFDDGMPFADDSTAIEVGREALSPLADHHSSAMPWNISSSLNSFRLRSSSVLRGQGRQSSVMSGRLGSRLPSASPLLSRGRHVSDNEMERTHLSPSRGATSTSAHGDEEFMVFGPSAAVDTQTAQNSQWVAEALETESLNFLEFVRCSAVEAEAEQKNRHVDDIQDASGQKCVSFETLFPPQESHRIVAAQAFYHVLSLATKNLLKVNQEEGGEIRMIVEQ